MYQELTPAKRKKIVETYQTTNRSIQDIARIMGYSVDQVLEAVGEGHLAEVESGGDMIDQSEAGPNAELNPPESIKVPFTTN